MNSIYPNPIPGYPLTDKQKEFLHDGLLHTNFSNILTPTERALVKLVISQGEYTPVSKRMLNEIRTKMLLNK